jgi:glycosyltransferase involved in cell wall biosynthesis
VDAVIPTLNCVRSLKRCLSSLLSQHYESGDFGVIVVDGGSTDGTVELARAFGATVYSRPGMYSNGLEGARNWALKRCRRNLYWQVDSDNYFVGQEALAGLARPFIGRPDVNISVPIPTDDQSISGLDRWLASFERERILSMIASDRRDPAGFPIPVMRYGICNGSLLRTSVLREVGYDSDVRVLERLVERGLAKGYIVDGVLYIHEQSRNPLNWAEKIGRRLTLFSRFPETAVASYFAKESRGPGFKRSMMAEPARILRHCMKLRKARADYWYEGFGLLVGYAVALILNPVAAIRVYRRFL